MSFVLIRFSFCCAKFSYHNHEYSRDNEMYEMYMTPTAIDRYTIPLIIHQKCRRPSAKCGALRCSSPAGSEVRRTPPQFAGGQWSAATAAGVHRNPRRIAISRFRVDELWSQGHHSTQLDEARLLIYLTAVIHWVTVDIWGRGVLTLSGDISVTRPYLALE